MANNSPPKLPTLPAPFTLAPRLPLQTTGNWNSKRAILHVVFHLVESEKQKDPNLRYCYVECLAQAVLGMTDAAAHAMTRDHVQALIRDLNVNDPDSPILIASRGPYARLLTVHFDTGKAGDLALVYVERMRIEARRDRAAALAKAMIDKTTNRPPLVSPI